LADLCDALGRALAECSVYISATNKRRTTGEYDILLFVPVRACTVSFTGPDGIRHSVNVQAETLNAAVAMAVRAFRGHDCAPTQASTLEVEARSPSVTHTVSMRKVHEWLEAASKSPNEKLVKERLKRMMAS
jgi:hypothetical protein